VKDETRCDNGFVLDNCHILYLDTQELGKGQLFVNLLNI